MRQSAKINANQMMDDYNYGFVKPFLAALDATTGFMGTLRPRLTIERQDAFVSNQARRSYQDYQPQNYSNTYNNTSFVNATFNGEGAAKGASNYLWTKP